MSGLFDIALTNAAIATLLAVAAFLASRFRLRPAVRHALWLLVLLKLIAPPLVPVRVILPSQAGPAVTQEAADLDAWTERRSSPSDAVVWAESLGVTVSKETAVAPASERSGGATAVLFDPATQAISWRMVVAAVWLAGSAVWLSVALIRILRFRRVLRETRPAGESICEHVRNVAAHIGLRRVPRVVMTSGAVSPLVWGFGITPKLLIPNGLWSRLGHEQRTTLLIHELAHLRRGDHLVRLLELAVTALYWWHPVAWWACRAIREAEEQCCDAWVVWAEPGSARAYADALLETVEFLSQAPRPPFAATGLGRVDHLKRRLTMILRGTTPRGLSRSGGLTILGLAGVLLPLSPIAAREEAKPEPHQYIKKLDVIPNVPGEVTIQEATPATEEPEANVETSDGEKVHDARIQELKKLRGELSELQMDRIEGEVELRVAQARLKSIKQQIDSAAEPTTDQMDAAKVAEKTVENLKRHLERYRMAEAKTKTNMASLAQLLRRVEYRRTHAHEIEKAEAEVSDARSRLDKAMLRKAEAEGLRKPGSAEITTTSQTRIKYKDGSALNTATMRFGVEPAPRPKTVPKVSPSVELGPDGRPVGTWKTEKFSTMERMEFYNKNGTITVFEAVEGDTGSKPKIRIRTLVRTDGEHAGSAKASDETNDFLKKYYGELFKSDEAIRSPEEQSLREQEAETRKILEKYSRIVHNPSSDPAMRHHLAQLAEIQAKLRAMHAPKPDPDPRINALEEKLNDVLHELKQLQRKDER